MNSSGRSQMLMEFEQLTGKSLEIEYKSLKVTQLRCPEELYDPNVPFNGLSLWDYAAPVMVVDRGNADYEVVDGCKRLHENKKGGHRECMCGVITSNPDEQNTGIMRILFNSSKQLHIREKVLFYSWIQKHVEGEEYNKLLNLCKINRHEQKQLLSCAGCSEDILDALSESRISLETGSQLTTLDQHERAVFLSLFSNLKLSFQIQREFLEWLPEIAMNEKCSVSDIVQKKEIVDLIDSQTLNAPQKIEKMRDLLFSMRFPRYSKALKEWKQHATAVNPAPKKVEIVHSPGFEKQRLTVHLSFSNGREAREICSKLKEISPSDWNKLLYPIE
ncbi:MAG: hypothetical protein GF401_04400 [Chitinivibrionales bacterium]|nr:hypothetical protein [Chitinivibrionales bacterium]